MAVMKSESAPHIIEETAPFAGDLRIKAWALSNDYDRVHRVFVGKVDARGQILSNLRIVDTDNEGIHTYQWEEVDPDDMYKGQLKPFFEVEQGISTRLYRALQDLLVQNGSLAPPVTQAAEELERKMLLSENTFLKELVQELAGTRKRESWRTTSIEDQKTTHLIQLHQKVRETLYKRGELGQIGTPTITSGAGTTGPGSASGSSQSSGPSGQRPIPSLMDTLEKEGWATEEQIGETYEQYRAASGQGDSEDRG